jgi:hypothetical protein
MTGALLARIVMSWGFFKGSFPARNLPVQGRESLINPGFA